MGLVVDDVVSPERTRMEAVPTRAKWAFGVLIALWMVLTLAAFLYEEPSESRSTAVAPETVEVEP